MDFEKIFVRYCLDSDIAEFYRVAAKVKASHFIGLYRDIWEFIEDHVSKYSVIPDRSIVESFSKITFDEEPTEPVQFYIDLIETRTLIKKLSTELKTLEALTEKGEPQAAIKKMEDFSLNMRKSLLTEDKAVSIFDRIDKMRETYDAIKSGKFTGIEIMWPTINHALVGFQPGDFVVFVARASVGKTFTLLTQANYSFMHGKRILFITPEITQDKLLFRFGAIHLKVPYGDLRRGMLGSFVEKKFFEDLEYLKATCADQFMIMGKELRADVAGIRAAAYYTKPDIIFIDSMYTLNPITYKVKDRFERVAIVSEEIKQLAIEINVPIIAAMQFNRNVAGKKVTEAASLENIALSDAIGWNIDWGFALQQDDDLRADKRMMIRTIKTRESEHIDDVIINWDFINMNFDEIGVLTMAGKYSTLSATVHSAGSSAVIDDDEVPF